MATTAGSIDPARRAASIPPATASVGHGAVQQEHLDECPGARLGPRDGGGLPSQNRSWVVGEAPSWPGPGRARSPRAGPRA